MDKILTVNDVAELLHVKPITVREMFRAKRLRAFKVGKSWRTTETMLQEDIEALARGESPATLPTPNGKSTSNNDDNNAKESRDASKSARSKAVAAQQPASSREEATPYPPTAPPPTGKDAAGKRSAAEDDQESNDQNGDEDLQQFLF